MLKFDVRFAQSLAILRFAILLWSRDLKLEIKYRPIYFPFELVQTMLLFKKTFSVSAISVQLYRCKCTDVLCSTRTWTCTKQVFSYIFKWQMEMICLLTLKRFRFSLLSIFSLIEKCLVIFLPESLRKNKYCISKAWLILCRIYEQTCNFSFEYSQNKWTYIGKFIGWKNHLINKWRGFYYADSVSRIVIDVIIISVGFYKRTVMHNYL